MAVQNLTLYDLIVDLTPGIAAIFVFVPLFPSKSMVAEMMFGSSFRFGLSLLILGYIAGRLLHATSGSKAFEALQDMFDKLYLRVYTMACSVIHWIFPARSRETDSAEDRLNHRRKVRSIEDRIEGNVETKSQQTCSEARNKYLDFNWDAGTTRFKHFGESLLYGQQGLYRKYEMLSTFYRNLAFLFSLASLVYLIYLQGIPYVYPTDGFLHKSIWTANTTNPYPYQYAPHFFLAVGFLCHTQRLKFEHRKNRAFVDDLYVKLVEDGPDELVKSTEQSAGGKQPAEQAESRS